jgi:DNA helicase-2/ATP-dependent DNA helicase PcrA
MNPTPQQLAAIRSDNPITFLIAGAGAGKTKTLIWRIMYLIEHDDIPPEAIVAITFTNAAAKEMQKRLDALSVRIGFIGTLHSFMLRLLRKYHDIVGYRPDINVLDEEESEAFRVKVESDLKYIGTKRDLDAAIALGPPTPTERLSKERLVAAHYYKQLKIANLMTFDSILIYGLKVCQWLKRATQITDAHPFTHYLIDEVQDSSALDFKIFGAFVGEPLLRRRSRIKPSIRSAAAKSRSVSTWRTVAKVYPLEDNFRCGSKVSAKLGAASH